MTPHLVCAGAAGAIAFYKKAFAAKEVMRMPGPGGNIATAKSKSATPVSCWPTNFRK